MQKKARATAILIGRLSVVIPSDPDETTELSDIEAFRIIKRHKGIQKTTGTGAENQSATKPLTVVKSNLTKTNLLCPGKRLGFNSMLIQKRLELAIAGIGAEFPGNGIEQSDLVSHRNVQQRV